MVELKFLSPNLLTILNRVIRNQQLMKYLHYTDKLALSKPNLPMPYSAGMFNEVHPYPFDETVETADCTQLRVYYPEGIFHKGRHTADIVIHFDIIVAKSLWLANDGTEPIIRPYKIMELLIKEFGNESISTLGKMEFVGFTHLNVNPKFHAIRMFAKSLAVN